MSGPVSDTRKDGSIIVPVEFGSKTVSERNAYGSSHNKAVI